LNRKAPSFNGSVKAIFGKLGKTLEAKQQKLPQKPLTRNNNRPVSIFSGNWSVGLNTNNIGGGVTPSNLHLQLIQQT